ncbi:MAG: hypothetical protein ACYDAI_09280 [Trichloromonadaceae bacterium]
MKTTAMLTTFAAALLLNASEVFAAGAGRVDHSGIVVWMFLGFCALILIAQLAPAVFMLVGAAKGLQSPRAQSAANPKA